jgi:cytochrome c oxidase cbb3-type subunit 3
MRWFGLALISAAVMGAGVFALHLRTQGLERRLMASPPDEVFGDPELATFADRRGVRVYRAKCASCHGAGMQGRQDLGAPNLLDGVWLYDFGEVSSIERTVRYGVRSGHPKARNVTDMPALGRTGQLTGREIADVSEFVLKLSHRDHDAQAAERGARIYNDKGVCYDCHDNTGLGNPDYGAPGLTGEAWLYGGDRQAIIASIRDGRHGVCPAWGDRLTRFARCRFIFTARPDRRRLPRRRSGERNGAASGGRLAGLCLTN